MPLPNLKARDRSALSAGIVRRISSLGSFRVDFCSKGPNNGVLSFRSDAAGGPTWRRDDPSIAHAVGSSDGASVKGVSW